jgi:flagellar basal body-associated protein FliL
METVGKQKVSKLLTISLVLMVVVVVLVVAFCIYLNGKPTM